jgi:hypothetical protein
MELILYVICFDIVLALALLSWLSIQYFKMKE